MKKIQLTYNPYTYGLTATVDKMPIGEYSAIRNFHNRPFISWFDGLCEVLWEEFRENVELEFCSREIEIKLLKRYIDANQISFVRFKEKICFLNTPVNERMKNLNNLIKNHLHSFSRKKTYKMIFYLAGEFQKYKTTLEAIKLENEYCLVLTEVNLLKPNVVLDPNATNIVVSEHEDDINHDILLFLLKKGNENAFINKKDNIIYYTFSEIKNVIFEILMMKTLVEAFVDAKNQLRSKFQYNKNYALLERIEPLLHFKPIDILEVGDVKTLEFTMEPSIANYRPPLIYRVEDPKVLRIDGSHIIGLSAGKTQIAVFYAGEIEPLYVMQTKVIKVIRITSINAPNYIRVRLGETKKIPVELTPQNADDIVSLRFLSDNTDTVVADNFYVSGKKAGVANITIKSTNCNANVKVEVIPSLKTIALNSQELQLFENQEIELNCQCFPQYYYPEKIYVSSSFPFVAEYVDNKVIAKHEGKTDIIFESETGVKSKCQVVVKKPDKSMVAKFKGLFTR